MLKTIWNFILRLFGVNKSITTDEQMQRNMHYANKFEETSKINFTAIFSNKLTTLAVSEATVDIIGDNARTDFLDLCASNLWRKIRRVSTRMLGTGGCAVIPYVKNGDINFDVVPQDRIIINEKQGDKIISATILSESVKVGGKVFYRWTDYKVNNNILYITNKITSESGNITQLEQWDNIKDIAISGVDRVLFAFLKSPIDNRKFHDFYGVPITYGCESTIDEIYECIKQIQDEFALKEVKVFADERMFDRDPKTGEYKIPSKMFFAARGNDKSMIDIFSPDIRDSSYYNRLMSLFELLEKSVGTSKGILTAPETRGATATEIKAGLYDTYALVYDIRTIIENGIKDYIYSCDVLANYFNLAPMGEYDIAFDWSYSMIESSAETWAQLKDAQAMGVKSKAEIRQWLNPNESVEEAQKKIEEIQKTEPTLNSLLGGGINA